MKSLAAGTITALSQAAVPIVQLVYLGFAAPVALNTSTWDIVYDGVTYRGAYGLGTISAVTDGPGEVKGLQFTLSGVSAAAISLALDGGDVWQGTPITIRTAILDANYAVTEAPIEWTGRGDVMSVSEDGDTCTVTATAESHGRGSAARLRHDLRRRRPAIACTPATAPSSTWSTRRASPSCGPPKSIFQK
jgi:hypothetical protein